MFDYLIVGAGFAGSVLAERLAKGANKKVLIIDKRNHIAGNAYDYYNKDGILVHKYGPHIFHTDSKDVFDYLSRFTEWNHYQHKVLASVDGQMVTMPINLNSDEVADFFAPKSEKINQVKISKDEVVGKVERELYKKFFKGYTKKQWGFDSSELDTSETAIAPTTTPKDDRYFAETYQVMPSEGYTKMFEKMLDHPNIKIMLNTSYQEIVDEIAYKKIIFTGPIDEYFNYCHGKLPYKSLEFKFETHDKETFQETGTINYPNDYAFTRITEFKYLTKQKHPKTSLVYEYPKADGDPCYPILQPENVALYKKYQAKAEQLKNTYFVGRLATYKYYNMDQVVSQALSTFNEIQKEAITKTTEVITIHPKHILSSFPNADKVMIGIMGFSSNFNVK